LERGPSSKPFAVFGAKDSQLHQKKKMLFKVRAPEALGEGGGIYLQEKKRSVAFQRRGRH